ncbi:MAG: branched-chain amino acid transaminase, partial [Mariprofundales bacterium]|nr:branched-chain amino acid transaminase [Mariprofundales bacterium]
GEMVPWRDAKVHVLTHTLHYGMGVFEGVRAYETERGAAVFRLDEHTARLIRSAKIMNMPMLYDAESIRQAQLDTIAKNGLQSAYLRPILFYGSEGMGLRADNLKVHLVIAAWEWGAYLGDEALKEGIRIRTSSYSRHHVNIAMCKAKACGHYINSMLALTEALRDGYDETLLLDVDGFVAEGSGENIFILRDSVLYTPDLSSALDGITRATIMQLATEGGIRVVEKRITRDEVYVADEVFFTGTAAEVTPIREVDGRIIGKGGPGQVTRALQEAYFDAVHGKDNSHGHWLSFVNG